MLIKCMRASRRRGLIVIVESKNASVATLQPLTHVLRNPMWLIGNKDVGGRPSHLRVAKLVGETFHNLARQLTKTNRLLPISTYSKGQAIASFGPN